VCRYTINISKPDTNIKRFLDKCTYGHCLNSRYDITVRSNTIAPTPKNKTIFLIYIAVDSANLIL
jgi:hypothetical protein